jgi:DMSO/TMAO reductase YedYZ heme-binding membrane subunit/uncharacterized protein with FMN-binding domain
MIILLSLVLVAAFVALCAGPLKRHPVPFYLGATVIAAVVCVCTSLHVSFPTWFNSWVWPLVSRSGLSAALFVAVMFAGALTNGSKPVKVLMPIRGELSILACILTLGHNISYGMTYFRRLTRLPSYQLGAAICSIVMICIMLPLFVTSFRCIRKKMKPKRWKQLQRLAYGFYALLYVHVLLLTVPAALRGRSGYALTIFVYSVVFLGYALCRVTKALAMRKKATDGLRRRQMILVALSAVVALGLSGAVYGAGAAQAAEQEAVTVLASTAPETVSPSTEAEPEQEQESEAPVSEEPAEEEAVPETEEPSEEPTETPAESEEVTTEEPIVAPEETEAVEETPEAEETTVPTETAAVTETAAPSETPTETPVTTTPVASAAPSPSPVQSTEPAAVSEAPATVVQTPEPTPEPEPVRVYQNGTFYGTAFGYDGNITVSVTIQDDVITAISVTDYIDDDEYFGSARAVINSILSAQSTSVDTVSGATYSSRGILNAVASALSSARN